MFRKNLQWGENKERNQLKIMVNSCRGLKKVNNLMWKNQKLRKNLFNSMRTRQPKLIRRKMNKNPRVRCSPNPPQNKSLEKPKSKLQKRHKPRRVRKIRSNQTRNLSLTWRINTPQINRNKLRSQKLILKR